MHTKAGLILLAVSLVAVLAFGGFAHAVIPHDHGDGHGGAPTALWSDLHAVLGSAQRKMFVAAATSILLVLLFSIVRYSEKSFLVARRREQGLLRSLDPIYGELLRCGVMPYRAFR